MNSHESRKLQIDLQKSFHFAVHVFFDEFPHKSSVFVLFVDFESKRRPLRCLSVIVQMIAVNGCNILIGLVKTRVQIQSPLILLFCFPEVMPLIIDVPQTKVQLVSLRLSFQHLQIPLFSLLCFLFQREAEAKSIVGIAQQCPFFSSSTVPLFDSPLEIAHLILNTAQPFKRILQQIVVLDELLIVQDAQLKQLCRLLNEM